MLEFARKNGLKMKGHCLVYNSFNPDWLPQDNRSIDIEMDRRMRELSDLCKYDLDQLDVINEMFWVYKNCYPGCGTWVRNLQTVDEKEHCDKMFRQAEKHFPFTELHWNEGTREIYGAENYFGERSKHYMMIERHLNKGTPIGGLAMQFHIFNMKEGRRAEDYKPHFSPLRLFDLYDCCGQLGLPIHIAEISLPSYTHEADDEQSQAELVRRMYRLWFAQKNIRSIVWWNLVDDTAYGSESEYRAGLLRRDLSEKPAYKVIEELIHKEWHTELDITTDKENAFTGFWGDYEISYELDGKKYTKTVSFRHDNAGYENNQMAPRLQKI